MGSQRCSWEHTGEWRVDTRDVRFVPRVHGGNSLGGGPFSERMVCIRKDLSACVEHGGGADG